MWITHPSFHFNWTCCYLVMSEKLAFLKTTEPFNLLPEAELESVTKEIREVTYLKQELLYQQNITKVSGLDIVVSGSYSTYIQTSDKQKKSQQQVAVHLTYGAFSILLNKGKSMFTVEVEKETRVYRLSPSYFRKLCKTHDNFYQFFLTAFGKEMLHDKYPSLTSIPEVDIDALTFDRYFVRKLDTVSHRSLISCSSSTPAYEAARKMEEHKLSCLFVEENGELKGYVTDIILRNKIIGQQLNTATPISNIMEGPIFRIDNQAYVYEAVLKMFDNMIRYLVVQEDGQDVGVVSRTKLLSDQAQSPFVFIQSVRLSLTLEELRDRWGQVPEVVYQLLTRGVKSEIVNQVITNISDTIAQKVIEGVIHELGEPPAKFVFMSLGSEGRKEQTLKTDQDNAIIYEDKANEFREKTRKYFLHFADLVSERLDYIGFAFCTGGLMAKNPKWTHSLSHWKRNYNQWIDNPDHEAAMNFSTFFDCRYIYGEEHLVRELQAHILDKLNQPSEYFFSLLASNALQYEPPLTFFRSIKTISKGDQQVFNIKRAMTPIVDLVRVYALKHKILTTNTGERLEALLRVDVITEADFHELMQSYYYLMNMRLRYQSLQIAHDHDEPHNYVNPKSLTKIEIVTVKEIFKVIEKFQQRIKIVFTRNIFG